MTTWICPVCLEELGELNGWCEYCKYKDGIIVYNPDKYFIRDIRIRHISEDIMDMKDMSEKELFEYIESNQNMTLQEKKFAKLFYHEAKLVKDMDRLTLRAHIEELADISFEGRARHSAATAEDKRREKEGRKSTGPTGFSRSVNVDEASTDAINAIKERQKKLTGKEKMLAGLAALYVKGGLSQAEADKEATKAMSAGTILAKIKEDKKAKDILTEKEIRSPLSQEDGFVLQRKDDEQSESKNFKPLFNPFEKK